jgi:hypothetical protein
MSSYIHHYPVEEVAEGGGHGERPQTSEQSNASTSGGHIGYYAEKRQQ